MFSPRKFLTPCLAAAVVVAPAAAPAATFSKLVDFYQQPTGGAYPLSGTFYYKGAFYGTTEFGGAYNAGSIYSFKPKQKHGIVNQVILLHSFHNNSNGLGADICGPQGEPAIVGTMMYGTGIAAGSFNVPGVYSYNLATGVETLLYNFQEEYLSSAPNSVIMVGKTLFGTTSVDGTNLNGTIFSVDPVTGKEKTLYAFAGGADGAAPYGGLTNVGGLLYGTTSAGGANGAGTIFSFDLGTKTKTTLYSFNTGTDGSQPRATMILENGLLYGTTYAGGEHGAGSVFRFDPATNTEVTEHSLKANTEGQNPVAPLIYRSGKLYGSASAGGPNGLGTVYEVRVRDGHLTVLHVFSGQDGGGPAGALHMHDANLYGTTFAGGAYGTGTIFEITP